MPGGSAYDWRTDPDLIEAERVYQEREAAAERRWRKRQNTRALAKIRAKQTRMLRKTRRIPRAQDLA